MIDTVLTIIAVAFAWYMQMIISAFYSGIRGGKLFAVALMDFLSQQGWINYLPCVANPFDPNDSYIDEAIGYTLGAIGFYFQITNGFALQFPLNLILLPLSIVEWLLRFQVSMGFGGIGGKDV